MKAHAGLQPSCKADHPTDSGQVAIDHQLPMLGIILEADHPHAAMRSRIDIV